MVPKKDIAALLDKAYQDYHVHKHLDSDPVKLIHRFEDPKDQEVAGLFCALVAYGNVRTIIDSGENILQRLGPSPYSTILNEELTGRFEGFIHRFTQGIDLEIFGTWLRAAYDEMDSLEDFFTSDSKNNIKRPLTTMVQFFRTRPLPKHLKTQLKSRQRNLKYLLSDPEDGSACKRLNMYLRWVARGPDGIDVKCWKEVPASRLILPIDTHLLKIVHEMGWTKSKTANWTVAEQATEILKKYCPEDPVRYDFSLCHLSMSGKKMSSLVQASKQ